MYSSCWKFWFIAIDYTPIFVALKAELREVQNMKVVDLYLIFMPVKGFCEITSMWDFMKVCLGVVQETILVG